jgi:hypothetical protein
MAVVRDGSFELGRSAVLVPDPGAVEAVTVEASVGRLVLVLPDDMELPEVGWLAVSLQAQDRPVGAPEDPWGMHESFLTEGSSRANRARLWTALRHDAGRLRAGRYALTVHVIRRDGDEQIPMLAPTTETIEIRAGETTEVRLGA